MIDSLSKSNHGEEHEYCFVCDYIDREKERESR